MKAWDTRGGDWEGLWGQQECPQVLLTLQQPLRGVMGWAHLHRKKRNNVYHCRKTGGRLKEHRSHLRNKTVVKQRQHNEGTTHAYNIFSPKQLTFGSGGRNALKGTGNQR